jgi:hypothetical protein
VSVTADRTQKGSTIRQKLASADGQVSADLEVRLGRCLGNWTAGYTPVQAAMIPRPVGKAAQALQRVRDENALFDKGWFFRVEQVQTETDSNPCRSGRPSGFAGLATGPAQAARGVAAPETAAA